MTREEVEEVMRPSEPIQASFEVIGDNVKFVKLIVNGKENIVSIEELENTLSEPCDCISREEVCDYIAEFVNHEYATDRERELVKHIIGGIQHLPSIQPTAKENLVVEDCISRAELLKAVDSWDKFGCDANNKLVRIKDCYVPYIHYDDVVKAIKGMSSVQPKITGYEDCISRQAVNDLIDELARAISDERCCMSRGRSTATIMQDILDLPPVTKPKTGHWIATEKDWWKCSECGQVIYSETEQDIQEYHAYCGRCGAKMLPTDSESEDKG